MIVFQIVMLPIVALLSVRNLVRLVRGERPRWVLILQAAIWAVAGVGIVRPSLTTVVANFLGIGRGADLVTYTVAIALILASFYFYRKYRRIESDITALVRHLALREGDSTDDDGKESPDL